MDHKVVKGREVTSNFKMLVNERNLSMDCAKALPEGVVIPALI